MSKFFHHRYFVAAFAVAVFALDYLSPERLFAQEEGGYPNSPPLDMIVNPGTQYEMWQTSHEGLLDPVGIDSSAQMAIMLSSQYLTPKGPVGITPLDGGEIFVDDGDLMVSSEGTVTFSFQAGSTPGMYRVAVIFGGMQYQLRLYVPRPAQYAPNCNPP
jgi:hypothetical protein